ncbi:hypothetical protein DH2020_031236 [Rehmannia glutinosa]|uniref:Homeobox-leucine zipper protein n=1 Tax=Rehmannia glutinosa TaxID=99300 RepID=A0ABR0VIJ9_REHGL
MKRLGSSDSLGALMFICPNSTDEHNSQGNNPVYTRDFETMMDGYDEEGCIEETGQGGRGSEKKRRLSVDQVKALEKNFEVENKLEPERKVKLAQELGLQPRQVAVWFQNRRARWKTKQLERDYGVLKANYDGLKLNFEKLQHDNETLMKEIRELKSKINEDGNNSDSKLSVKEEELLSDTEEKSKLEIPANEIIKQNGAILHGGASGFGDFKDGLSSDSDSSAILNEDNNNIIHHHHSPPHQFLEIQNINFQFQDSTKPISGNILGDAPQKFNNYHHQPQFVKIEEHNFFGEESCSNLFSDDQAPTLHWWD